MIEEIGKLVHARKIYLKAVADFEEITGIGVCAQTGRIQLHSIKKDMGDSVEVIESYDGTGSKYPVTRMIFHEGIKLFSIHEITEPPEYTVKGDES